MQVSVASDVLVNRLSVTPVIQRILQAKCPSKPGLRLQRESELRRRRRSQEPVPVLSTAEVLASQHEA